MSIIVKEIVLHQLVKKVEENGDNSTLTTQLRQSLLTMNDDVSQMMLLLHQHYQAKNKNYAVFKEDSAFALVLNQWLEEENDFLQLSYQSANNLCQELGKYPFADNGTLVMCHYNFLATDYLFIALLDSYASLLVDDALEVQPTQYLEVKQFDIACRINLTDLRTNAQSNRYLTFLNGRVGRRIADFFMDFLGAEEGFNPKVQNQCLLQAVNDFCKEGELSSQARREVKKQVFDYCKEQLANGEEITLTELSGNLPTLNEKSFADFTQQEDYGLEEQIPPVRSSLKTLTKFSGSGKGITLSFEAALLNDRIHWDEEKDCLTIQGLPPNLRDQLERNK